MNDRAQHGYRASSQFLIGGLQLFIAPWVWTWLVAGVSPEGRSAVVALATSILGGAAWAFAEDDVVGARTLLTLGLGLLAIAFDHRAAHRHPSVIASLPTAQLMSIASWVWVMDRNPDEFPILWSYASTPRALETIQLMILGALLAYEAGRWAAYASGAVEPAVQLTRASFDDLARTDAPLVLLAALGIGTFGLILGIRGFGYLATLLPTSIAGLLGNIEFLYYVGLYAAMAAALRRRWRLPFVITWTLAAFAYELLSGSKGRFVLYILIPMALVYALTHEKTPRRIVAGVVTVGLVSWLLVYPALIDYRRTIEEGTVDDPVAAMAETRQHSTDSYADRVLTPIVQAQLAEQAMAMLTIVEFDVRRPPVELPQRLFLFWIPRLIWPEKPLMLDVNEIGRESHRLSAGNTTTAVLITSVGEQYVYMGFWGFLLSFPVGFVTAVLVAGIRVERRATDLEIGLVVYLFRIIPGLISGSFEGSFTGNLLQTIVLVAFVLLARSLQPQPNVAPVRPT